MGQLMWVVYWWTTPFLGEEQTHSEKFVTRDEAREFLKVVRQRKDFVKADEIKQYGYKHLEQL